jgi:plastocyanin
MSTRLLTLVAALAAALSVAAVAGARPAAPSFVQVTEKEWQITLSRTSVKAGKVFVEVVNFGTDAHDLVVLRRKKGAKPVKFPQVDPNERSEKPLTLAAGRYTLWCSLPGHSERGMKTTLVVRA